jgi:hypothetical protein
MHFLFELTIGEIIMTSSQLIKTSNRALALLTAALLLQTGGTLAARADDAQTQARELLSQTAAGRSVAAQSNGLSDGGTSLPGLDPQEQARRVLLGTQSPGGEAEAAASRYATSTPPAGVAGAGHFRSHSDAQEMARRMILGTVI